MPLATRPIAVMPIMVVVGVMPMITSGAVRFTPFVVVERQRGAGKMNPGIGMPAVTFPIASCVG